MISQHERNNRFIRPNFQTYTLVKSACVRTFKYLSPEEKRKNFDIVMRTFQDVARNVYGLKPGSISFRIMLTACKSLLPPGREQQNNIRAIFEHCCRVGVVDRPIFYEFRATADRETFQLVTGLDENASLGELPVEWRKNSKQFNNNL